MNCSIKYILIFLLSLTVVANPILGQPSANVEDLPTVFFIGEYEKAYEELNKTCDKKLLANCEGSMELAYAKWMGLLSDIESYSEEIGFDVKGLKIWINIYWNPNGTIKHLVYWPKPNSKNMDFEQLSDFFTNFLAQYQSPITDEVCFSHNGNANFPIYAKLFIKKDR